MGASVAGYPKGVRFMFSLYVVTIAFGLVAGTIIGLTHH
jgi:hypothetical protein